MDRTEYNPGRPTGRFVHNIVKRMYKTTRHMVSFVVSLTGAGQRTHDQRSCCGVLSRGEGKEGIFCVPVDNLSSSSSLVRMCHFVILQSIIPEVQTGSKAR